MNIGLAVIAARDARARCLQGGGAIVRVRILVALSVCLAARAAIAAACNGGTCPAANLIVSNILSPESAGTVSSVRVEARTSNGATATLYAGTIHFTSTDTKAVLPADYTFTTADKGVHVFTNSVTLKTAGTQSVTATDTKTATIKGSQTGIVVNALAASYYGLLRRASGRHGDAHLRRRLPPRHRGSHGRPDRDVPVRQRLAAHRCGSAQHLTFGSDRVRDRQHSGGHQRLADLRLLRR